MEITDPWGKQIERGRHSVIREFTSGMAVTIALLAAGSGVLHAQQAPAPPSAPQVAPQHHSEPEVAPEPPEPPELPETPEAPDAPNVFFMNDGGVHLGVNLDDVTPQKAQELSLPAVAGAMVHSVQTDSAAAKAGIADGDVIVEFDSIHVRSSAELRRLIRETPAGRNVEIKIIRGGKSRVLNAKLEASPNQYSYSYNMPEIHIPPIHVPEMHIPPMNFPGSANGWGGHPATLGISADDLSPQLAQFFGVTQGKGVLVFEVTQGGPADKAGLKAGDVIVQVDGKSVSGTEELRAALNDNFTGDTRKVSLLIVRNHHEQTVSADLTRMHQGMKHTSSLALPNLDQQIAAIESQARQQASQQRELANQQRVQAIQLRVEAERQRIQVQSEVMKQQQYLKTEWQRQLKEQMLSLKDQLKKMQDLHLAFRQDGEI